MLIIVRKRPNARSRVLFMLSLENEVYRWITSSYAAAAASITASERVG